LGPTHMLDPISISDTVLYRSCKIVTQIEKIADIQTKSLGVYFINCLSRLGRQSRYVYWITVDGAAVKLLGNKTEELGGSILLSMRLWCSLWLN
jgi:hypothetical protein